MNFFSLWSSPSIVIHIRNSIQCTSNSPLQFNFHVCTCHTLCIRHSLLKGTLNAPILSLNVMELIANGERVTANVAFVIGEM